MKNPVSFPRFLFLLLLLPLLNPVNGLAQSIEKQVDHYVTPFVEAGHFSGVILLARDGKVVYEKAFGLANAEHQVPNRPETRIGIASLTKPLTVVVLLSLMESGVIAIDDTVDQYLPEFQNGDRITIEMLARHRSGIAHRVMPVAEEALPHSLPEMIEKISRSPLEFEPGTATLYSSGGYTTLARVLEVASGKSWARLLQEYVIQPAGMEDTRDFAARPIIEHRAQEYLMGNDGMVNAPRKDYSFLTGAGSILSTAGDVYRFGIALMDGKLGTIARAQLVPQGVFSANGSTNGLRAFVKLQAENRSGYILLSNLNTGANDMILAALPQILDGKEVSPPVIPDIPAGLAELPADASDTFGKYRVAGSDSRFEVTGSNGALYAGDRRLIPVAPDRFFDWKGYGHIRFIRDTGNRVTGIEWESPQGTTTWQRQK